MRDKIKYNSTDEEVLAVLHAETHFYHSNQALQLLVQSTRACVRLKTFGTAKNKGKRDV